MSTDAPQGFVARDLHGADALGLMAERPVRSLFNPRTITTQAELSFLSQSAKDGDEVYVLADSANGVRWRFRYNASSTSAYRWECVDPVAMIAEVTTGEVRNLGTFGDVATVGPALTLPVGGDYDITIRAEAMEVTNGAQVAMSYDIGSTAAVTADEARNTTAANFFTTLNRTRRKAGLAAGTAIVAKYLASSLNGTFRSRSLEIRPVRVG